jgi:hypothetical protein
VFDVAEMLSQMNAVNVLVLVRRLNVGMVPLYAKQTNVLRNLLIHIIL